MTEQEHKKHMEQEKKPKKKIDLVLILLIVGIVVLGGLVVYNNIKLADLRKGITEPGIGASLESSVLPTGVPEIYGKELGIKYGDVSATNPSLSDQTIRKLGTYDQTITLSGEKLNRYIKIGSQISCEYCCGAQAIIFSTDSGKYKAGDAACGCAHSYAMRGLAKYLLSKHSSEYSDDQILEELGKWKVLFFPDIHMKKAAALQQKGIELNYINLASNKYRGIEQGATGGMVGGC